jgi:hypothetical protein
MEDFVYDGVLNIIMFLATITLISYTISKGIDDFEMWLNYIYLSANISYFLKKIIIRGE